MSPVLNLNSIRSQRARMARRFGKTGGQMLAMVALLMIVCSSFLFLQGMDRIGYGILGIGLLLLMVSIWDRGDLQRNTPDVRANTLDGILDSKLLASFSKKSAITPKAAWVAALAQWQGRFLANHLLIYSDDIEACLSDSEADMANVWQAAGQLAAQNNTNEIHACTLAASLMISSPAVVEYLAKNNLKPENVVQVYEWLERLNKFINQPKPYFGGIGRDWAAGFTPILDRFGENISREVESGAGHFHTLAHADILDSVVHNLNQGSGSVALIGEAGSGKTSLVYALAQRLLEGRDGGLEYYQIISLSASGILSSSGDQLERIMLTLFSEAAHAKNIIIFLDDARLFFSQGTGAFDAGQVLMPLVQNHSIKLITAFTPGDFQHLKSANPELVAHLPAVTVSEPPADITIKVLEDTALNYEARDNIVISYQAIKEAYRLSGQFIQDMAYPGKAISLIEQAIPYINDGFMTAESIQQAVEKTRGVKVGKAEAAEADTLLHLEDLIHQRMINQEKAVKVVAAALRRGRAGVGNPNRPVGSFLFLGPTGVGKTELARSLAATYFGDEHQMIRLDMSEYQQPTDVSRLIDAGEGNTNSLLLQIRQQPFSVVLLDEIEKSNPGVLNLLLQLLDEGQLTDQDGHAASFKNAIIIATSNAGSADITARVAAGETLDGYERPLIDKLIGEGLFKPELINRFDEVVLFRPLNESEMGQVANLMLAEVNKALANQNILIQLTEAALQKVVHAGYDPQFGARPMRRVIQRMVEDSVAKKVLSGEATPGSVITLDVNDLSAES